MSNKADNVVPIHKNLGQAAALPTEAPIKSHRKGLGQLIVAYKKFVRLLIGPYLRNVFEAQQQNHLQHEVKTQKLLSHVTNELDQLRSELKRSHNRISLLEAELDRRATGDKNAQAEGNYSSLLEEHYLAFEERFRGSKEEIQNKQRHYAPILKAGIAHCKAENTYVLDIGCGRGELLELLREHQVPARGVDSNEANVNFAKAQGLDVVHNDALSYLRELPEGSLGGISCCQVIEHLPVPVLLEFIELCYSRLADGAALILETINPLSIYAMRTFTLDLTHEKLIHPETAKFFLHAVGFTSVDVQFQAPVPEEIKLADDGNANTAKLNEFLYGNRDYAVIAYR